MPGIVNCSGRWSSRCHRRYAASSPLVGPEVSERNPARAVTLAATGSGREGIELLEVVRERVVDEVEVDHGRAGGPPPREQLVDAVAVGARVDERAGLRDDLEAVRPLGAVEPGREVGLLQPEGGPQIGRAHV